MRRWLARARKAAAERGLELRPFTERASGGYAGFALAWRRGDGAIMRGAIAEVVHEGHRLRLFVDDERDLIQKTHVRGALYEPEELAIIARHFTGGTFVDVGANVGNHAVFAGAVLGAEFVIAIEPNTRARRLLAVNLSLNDLGPRSRIEGVGLSASSGRAAMYELTANNLGSARIGGDRGACDVKLVAGDRLLAADAVSFVKIDVEGHELEALRGMAGTLERCQPVLFVEIEDENRRAVWSFLEGLGYVAHERFARYEGREHVLFRFGTEHGGRAATSTQREKS